MNSRWTLYLALFFLSISSVHAATILESVRWTNGIGSDEIAWTDGDTSRNYWCNSDTIDPRVFAASEQGWPGPGNVFSTRNTEAGCGGFLLDRVFPRLPQAGDIWVWRYYYKQDAISHSHQHGLGDLNPVGTIDMTFHRTHSLREGMWNHVLGVPPADFGWNLFDNPDGNRGSYDSSANRWTRWMDLQPDTWYRFEHIIEWVSNTEYRIYPRVYDLEGNLLADERYYIADYVNGVGSPQRLVDYYSSSGLSERQSTGDSTQESIRNWYIGVAQSKSSSEGRHYYASVDVGVATSNTDFLGPVDGQSSSNIVWESDWSTATGYSDSAILDGGAWSGRADWTPNWGDVVSTSTLPGTWPSGMNNALRAWYGADMWGGGAIINNGYGGTRWTVPETGETLFYRWYMSNNVRETAGNIDASSNHPFQGIDVGYGAGCTSHWETRYGSNADGTFNMDVHFVQNGGWGWYLPDNLPKFRPHFMELAFTRVAPNRYTVRARVNGVDRSADFVDYNDVSLADFGTMIIDDYCLQTMYAGNNGPLGWGSADPAQDYFVWAGVAVAIDSDPDAWIGPYSGQSTPPDNPPQDTTPPIATITIPSSDTILPEGTTSTTLSVSTNEPATCRYSTSNEAYVAMPHTLSGAGTTSHSGTISGLSSGGFTYYVRCQDTAGNAMSSSVSISFSVAQPPITYDGDVNGDGIVDIQDILIVVSNLGRTTFDARADRNGDGAVNVFDLVLVAKYFGLEYEAVDTRLIAYYSFDEGTGSTVNDQTANNHHGTIQGTPNWVTGVSGSALQLDGTSNYLSVPHSPSLSITNEITLMAWVNTPGDEYDNIIVKGSLGSAYALFLYNRGIEYNLGTYTQTSQTIPANTWTHIALSYDGSTVRVYRDGTQVHSAARSGTLGTNTQALHIGAATGFSPFTGIMDEVRVYNTALSQAEIQSVMNE